ncbi:MAG: YjjG family noncanonical pyrimidine nucleotidase [Clostridia bacterium]|nr:YjjG family noncanonical pyrimidine nucleotidase [Clostridia bacterium]
MLNKNDINAIFIDLDETILDFKKSQCQAIKKCFNDFNLPCSNDMINRYDFINDNQWKLYELGKTSKEELSINRFKLLFQEFNLDLDPVQMQKKYIKHLGEYSYYLYGAKKGINILAKKYLIYIVTNGTYSVQINRIKQSKLDRITNDIFISDKIGFHKPEKEFFDYCFKKTNLEKENVVLIGDSLTSDIKGGIEYNLKTIWFNRNNKTTNLPITANVKSWYEIIQLLI